MQGSIFDNSMVKIVIGIIYVGFLYTFPSAFLLAVLLYIGTLIFLYKVGQTKSLYGKREWILDAFLLFSILLVTVFVLVPSATSNLGYEISITEDFFTFENSNRRRLEWVLTFVPLWLLWVLAVCLKENGETRKWKVKALFLFS